MQQLLLVNPKKRRGKRRTSKKRTVTRRKRRTSSRKRRRNPGTGLALSNPRRRSRKRNPAGNPRGIGKRFIPSANELQKTGFTVLGGASGALGLDIAMGYLPIPAEWKAGPLGNLTKAVVAIGLGVSVNKFIKNGVGTDMTNGCFSPVK